jgi:hypothetical protein
VITTYDQQGFATLVTVAAGASALPKSYDWRGFLITDAPSAPATTSTALANVLENNAVNSTKTIPSESVSPVQTTQPSATPSTHTNDSYRVFLNLSLLVTSAIAGAMLLL